MFDRSSISPLTPQTTAVSPRRTTALPEQWLRLPVFMVGLRNSKGARPLGREGFAEDKAGERWARRNGDGESAAKISRGKDREGVAVAIDSFEGWSRICPA
jgi:hypothetical protein